MIAALLAIFGICWGPCPPSDCRTDMDCPAECYCIDGLCGE